MQIRFLISVNYEGDIVVDHQTNTLSDLGFGLEINSTCIYNY